MRSKGNYQQEDSGCILSLEVVGCRRSRPFTASPSIAPCRPVKAPVSAVKVASGPELRPFSRTTLVPARVGQQMSHCRMAEVDPIWLWFDESGKEVWLGESSCCER
jgi:hypothetical protein